MFFVLQRNPAFKIKMEAGDKDGPLAFGVFRLAEHKSGIRLVASKQWMRGQTEAVS